MCCITVDLHSDCFTVARRKDGDSSSSKVIKKYLIQDDQLLVFKGSLSKDDYIGVEASTNAFWFYDEVCNHVKKVIIFDTNKINFKGNKTDSNDAKKLLDVLEYFVYVKGEKEIPQVYVPEKQIRKMRELFSTYKLLKKMENQLKNRIYSILRQYGHVIKRTSLQTIKGKKLALELANDEISKLEIQLLLNQLSIIDNDTTNIKELLANIGNTYYKHKVEILMTIPGISYMTALAIISDIADIKRFPSAKKFCSYLRVAPKIKESNKSSYIGHINRSSRSLTLSLLTQSVTHFKNSSTYFNDFYIRMKSGKGYGKARIALIRKILVSAYYMLRRDESFKWSDKSNMQRKIGVLDENASRGEILINKIA